MQVITLCEARCQLFLLELLVLQLCFEDIRDACFEPLLRGERAPGCAGVQEDLAVATLLCCSPG